MKPNTSAASTVMRSDCAQRQSSRRLPLLAATEHVKPATFAAVQKHRKTKASAEDVQWGDEPDHGEQDTETTGPIGIPDQAGSGLGLVDPVLDDPGEVLGVETCAADQRAVDIGLGHEFGSVPGFTEPPY